VIRSRSAPPSDITGVFLAARVESFAHSSESIDEEVGYGFYASHGLGGAMHAHPQLAAWAGLRCREQSQAGRRIAERARQAGDSDSGCDAGLRPLFDEIISTDRAKTFKPNPRAYALGPSVLKLRREEIAFAAFGGWDAAGAKWFGYPSFWVNRLGVTREELPPGPDAVGSTLAEVVSWVAAR